MTDYHELYYGPIGYRIRWRIAGWNEDGQPYGLELERFYRNAGKWVEIPNHNVRDAFILGLMAARNLSGQTELAL